MFFLYDFVVFLERKALGESSMNTKNTTIKNTTQNQHSQLISLWDECVAAVPHYFNLSQLAQIKVLFVQHRYFEHLQLFHLEVNSVIAGFIGIAYDKIEILFVSPKFMRQGAASILLKHALNLGVKQADVNEDSDHALNFYLKHGFQPTARSEFDLEGNPYPILHLKNAVA